MIEMSIKKAAAGCKTTTATTSHCATNFRAASARQASDTAFFKRNADAATDKAEDLPLQLNRLNDLVKMAALAAEARRVLSGIHEAGNCQPELQEAVIKAVPDSNTRLGLKDVTGKVFNQVARQLDEVKASFTNSVYSLSRMKQGSES